jgi:sugar O-acyltransferase (sialic acid O-acetyltransferase NeuD family)
MRQLLIIGAGGLGRETAEVVRAINAQEPTWALAGFLDDHPERVGDAIDGVPVLGPVALAAGYPDAAIVVCTGNPRDYFSRRRIVDRLDLPPSRYATLVHPAAAVPRSVQIGCGTVLLASVVATAGVRVGAHCVVMPAVVLTHDDVIGEYVTIGAGARLGGRVTVGDEAYIGAGALIREDCAVGAAALIGMGAVVLTTVPEREVWVGVPARRLRAVAIPDEP